MRMTITIDQLIDDMINTPELDQRVQIASNIVIFGIALGPDAALDLLIRLQNLYENQSEEVVQAIASRIADLLRVTAYKVEQVSQSSVNVFLEHMYAISGFNSLIINKALSYSFAMAIRFINCFDALVVFVQKLQGSQNTLQRGFAAQITPILYSRLSDDQSRAAMGTTFGLLVSDADSFVRAQSAIALKIIISTALNSKESDKFICSPNYLYVCYDRLVQDLSDQVRAQNCVNGVLVLRYLLEIQKQDDQKDVKEIKEVLPGLIKNISRGSSDRYWKVRMQTAVEMPDFFQLISKKLDAQDCAVMFRLLSEDCEQDIRIISQKNAAAILRYLDSVSIINVFCPTLFARANEKETLKVKSTLCCQLGELIKTTSQLEQNDECKQIVSKTIEDCARKMFTDKAAEIRQQVILSLPAFQYSFIQEIIQSVLANKEKWIVKAAMIDIMKLLMNQTKPLIEEAIILLIDDVYEVRTAMSVLIKDVSLQIGPDFVKSIENQLLRLARSNTSNYQNRVSVSGCIVQQLQTQIKYNTEFKPLNAVLLDFCTDKSSFVRQEVVTQLRKVLEFAADNDGIQVVIKVIAAALQKLETDGEETIRTDAEELKEVLQAFE